MASCTLGSPRGCDLEIERATTDGNQHGAGTENVIRSELEEWFGPRTFSRVKLEEEDVETIESLDGIFPDVYEPFGLLLVERGPDYCHSWITSPEMTKRLNQTKSSVCSEDMSCLLERALSSLATVCEGVACGRKLDGFSQRHIDLLKTTIDFSLKSGNGDVASGAMRCLASNVLGMARMNSTLERKEKPILLDKGYSHAHPEALIFLHAVDAILDVIERRR